MRPVTKGNPPNYPFYTNGSETGTNMTYNANSSVAIVYNALVGAVVGPAVTFTVRRTLEALFNVTILGYVFPNPVDGEVKRAIKLFRSRLEALYLPARADLVGMLGEFCSFCELPIADHLLPVEHRAPKAPYPTYTVWWQNFLLACRDCNSKKGSKPSRATTLAWAGGANPSENARVDAIKSQYYWPDIDSNTYRVIGRQYKYNTNTLAPVTMNDVDAASRENFMVGYTATTVTANVDSGGAMQNNVQVEVQIIRNGGNATIGNRTLALTGINATQNGRCAQRTRVWLGVCAELENLMTTVGNTTGGGANKRRVFNGMWVSLLRFAARAGFYSVWVDITNGYPFPLTMDVVGLQADLGAQFLWDSNPAHNANVDQVFRGVNVAQVP